jgi:RimJ/RimL family protein N-acetyltransferase
MPSATKVGGQTYPRQMKLGEGRGATLRLMTPADRDAVLGMARSLPQDDLLFLRMDITQPRAVDEWVDNVQKGRTITVMAEMGGQIAAYASLHINEVLWTRHVGEIRIIVAPKYRRLHLGRRLAEEVFAIAKNLGLKKITAQMTPDQIAARATFERLGFQPEALLADYVVDLKGQTRDLLIMSYDVAGFHDTVEP